MSATNMRVELIRGEIAEVLDCAYLWADHGKDSFSPETIAAIEAAPDMLAALEKADAVLAQLCEHPMQAVAMARQGYVGHAREVVRAALVEVRKVRHAE